jgi:hypothetical protein
MLNPFYYKSGEKVFKILGNRHPLVELSHAQYKSNITPNLNPIPPTDKYPWSGGEIFAYYYWTSDFTDGIQSDVSYPIKVTEPQTLTDSSNDFTYGTTLLSYNPDIPYKSYYNHKLNSIFIFSQYADASYNTSTAISSGKYDNSIQYFNTNGISNYLIGLCFGGGNPGQGDLTAGPSGTIQSIYTAITPLGSLYTYSDSIGGPYTITGTGTLSYGSSDYKYNCVVFDIEISNASLDDFLNLYTYIKNINPKFIIISVFGHSCSWDLPSICQGLLQSNLSDYISPINYTQYFGTANEYTPNSVLPWYSFFNTDLIKNSKFITYGSKYILPSIFFINNITINGNVVTDLYISGGSNNNEPPNLYYWQSSQTMPINMTSNGGTEIINYYTKDTGINDFFISVMKNSGLPINIPIGSSVGGAIQWINSYGTTL